MILLWPGIRYNTKTRSMSSLHEILIRAMKHMLAKIFIPQLTEAPTEHIGIILDS